MKQELDKRKDGEYVINVVLDNKSAEQHIRLYEQSIIDDKVILNENMPYFELAETEFMKYQTIISDIQNKIAASEAMLHSLVAFRNNINPNKTITLIRTKSHLDRPVVVEHKKKLHIAWIKQVVNVLTEANMFMKADDIFSTILSRNDEIKNTEEYRKRLRDALYKLTDRNNSNNLIVVYKNKYGLIEWIDANKIPLPNYIKEFIYGNEDSNTVVKMKSA